MAKSSTLFFAMLKEEWKIHSTLFGNVRFAFFPLLIILIGFLGFWAISIFQVLFTMESMILFSHYLFVFFGASVGAFGMMGKEFMNRRFGQASLIAYSSRTLPVGDKRIFSMMVLKDIFYYFFLWVLPLIIGYALATPLTKLPFALTFVFLLTFTLSFLIGLSIVFFLSMVYARVGKLLLGIVVILGIIAIATTKNIISALPSYLFYYTMNSKYILFSLAIIIIPALLAILFVKFDFPIKTNRFKNALGSMMHHVSFAKKYAVFISKDFLDLRRTDGGFGKIFFSFLIPLSFVWVFISFLVSKVQGIQFIILFAMFLGILSSSIYTWLTEYDLFNQYLFLPVTVSTIIKSKIIAYSLINIVSIVILIIASIIKHQLSYLPVAFVIFIVMSFFTLAITILYTGLSPSIMFMDIKVLSQYLGTLIPVMLILIFVYVWGTFYLAIATLILLLIGILVITKAFRKWDKLPQQTF
jgi:hypothetical protein